MKTDIEIAQEAVMQPIKEVAASYGIGEDDLRADFVQFARGRPLDGRLRAHRHEDRGLDVAVRGMHNAAPRMGFRVLFDKVKRYG